MINIAILGTGKIIPEAISAIQASGKFRVVNIWARKHSRDKAAALAEKFHVEKFTVDLDEIFSDAAVDFVYIGLANAAHFDYAKRALLAGKNVILEKPFTVKYSQATELAELATKKNLYLFEAVTNLHCPNFFKIRDTLAELGEIKFVQCNYSQYSSRYDAYKREEVAPAFDPKNFGGALLDINIYNLNLIVALFGEPQNVDYFANVGFNGIDTSGLLVLRYKNFIAQSVGAKDSASPCFITIQGDNGFISVNSPPNELQNLTINIRGRQVQSLNLNQFNHRMVHEFIEFAEIFEAKDFSKVTASLKTSVAVIKIAELALKSAGLNYG